MQYLKRKLCNINIETCYQQQQLCSLFISCVFVFNLYLLCALFYFIRLFNFFSSFYFIFLIYFLPAHSICCFCSLRLAKEKAQRWRIKWMKWKKIVCFLFFSFSRSWWWWSFFSYFFFFRLCSMYARWCQSHNNDVYIYIHQMPEFVIVFLPPLPAEHSTSNSE